MTVYVDNAKILATVGRIRARWSHLTADSKQELFEFAERLGLGAEWFQTCKTRCGPAGAECVHWHFDVTSFKRTQAVAIGAVEIDMRQLGAIISERRAAQQRPAETGPCCDMHNRHCEPPADLCCGGCTEVRHPDHPAGVACVLAAEAVR